MNFALLAEYGPALGRGLLNTIYLSAVTLAIATPLGAVIALLRETRINWIAIPAAVYVNTFRLLPALLVLFFTFYALPQFGLRLAPMTAAIIGLSVVGAAYMSEDIRGGLAAVDQGQYRAAKALGLSYPHTIRRIIIPQAIPLIIPPYVTRAIIMVKATSLASFVAVGDLTGEAVRATSITYEPFMFFILAGVLYLLLSGVLALFQMWAEERTALARRPKTSLTVKAAQI
jgi:His/Glu/Gln/Arg/opine family amino acid ABC transporter permease subunit